MNTYADSYSPTRRGLSALFFPWGLVALVSALLWLLILATWPVSGLILLILTLFLLLKVRNVL